MKRQTDFLFIIIPTFIVILLWITFTIFQKATSTTITKTQTSLLKPISPTFDTSVVALLNRREKVTPNLEEVVGTTPTPVASSSSPVLTIPPTPTATSTAQESEVLP